jgi:hypothetical protein
VCDLLLVHGGQLDVKTLGRLLKPLQLGQGRLDALRQDRVHHKVLVEEAFPRVLVALEYHEVPVVGDLSTDRSDLLRVEELAGRPLQLLPLQVVRRVGAERTAVPPVVDPRQQLQQHLVARHVDVVHLRQVVLELASLDPHPLLVL